MTDERLARYGDAIIETIDDALKDLAAKAAEVEHLRQDRDEWKQSTIAANRRFETAEAMVVRLTDAAEGYRGLYEAAEAKVARVEALAEEWRMMTTTRDPDWMGRVVLRELLNALADAPAEVAR
jgi:hypothetical protein